MTPGNFIDFISRYFFRTTKVLIIASLLMLLWFVVPVGVDSSLLAIAQGEKETAKLEQPIKTYFLTILPQVSRQKIDLNPPATRIVVTSRSGDTAIVCGDGVSSYSCLPGKPLKLVYEPDTPVKIFWGKNQSEMKVQLKIDVYEVSPQEQDSEQGETIPIEREFI